MLKTALFIIIAAAVNIQAASGQVNLQTKIDSLNNLAFSLRRSNPKESLRYALEAIKLSSNNKYPMGYAAGLHNRGTAKAILGQMDQSLKDLMEAARLREELNDIEGLSTTYNNIGYVFSEIGNDKKALEFYTKSLEFHRQSVNSSNIGIVLNNIGWVNLRSKKYDLSLEYFYMAMEANKKENNERGFGASMGNIGTIYGLMGDHARALEYHKKALEIVEKNNDRIGATSINLFLADDYLNLKRYNDAIAFAQKSMLLAREIGYVSDEKNAAAKLAEIFEATRQFDESIKYHKLVSQLKDSLINIQKTETIGKIESIYEIELQARENEMLRREQTLNREKINLQWVLVYSLLGVIALISILSLALNSSRKKIKEANSKLQLLNEESNHQKEVIQIKIEELNEKNVELTEINTIKDKLISVIAHDLKNPLHSIAGYAEVLISKVKEGNCNEALSYLRIIHDNSIRGNLLLDNLLQWSQFQIRTLPFNPNTELFESIVKDELYLVQPIADEKEIRIECNFSNDLRVYADANMLRTIIRNLVANSIKFSNKNGKIEISATQKEDHVMVAVSDNGTGIDPQIKPKIFSGEAGVTSKGTSGEKGTGLGLMICKNFVERHMGTIWFESEHGGGTTFFVTLPNQKE